MPRPELWGGVEATHDRVGDRYFDQLDRSGHSRRRDDLDRFAAIGFRALRYPVLWERVEDARAAGADPWEWSDDRLERIRSLGMRPIVGLVHHGSGPRHTSLVDPAFADGLAAHARAVAERYPWVKDWTPVNEIVTTARFSTLYGHWYPHARDPRAFLRAVSNQVRGTVLAMRAIREVIPDARLVQTEDVGYTFATARLDDQARHENERRWAALDLLAGRIDESSEFWRWAALVLGDADVLAWHRENTCAPDIIGVNHYPTSQRWLDERRDLYPAWSRGGNGREAYADVEAVRARPEGILPVRELLAQAWQRYAVPLAITEVHTWATREQQIRWLVESWEEATGAIARGIDVRAVTAWAILGSFDWDHLCLEDRGHYEAGAFDVRSGEPRRTALATVMAQLARTGKTTHPAADGPRWWRENERLVYGPARQRAPGAIVRSARPVLILGADTRLGVATLAACAERGIATITLADPAAADADAIAATIEDRDVWRVIDLRRIGRIDDVERDEAAARLGVADRVATARACAARRVHLTLFSTDLVFDGASGRAYVETDAARPISAYGRVALALERDVQDAHPDTLVVRTGPIFGTPGDLAARLTEDLRRGREVPLANDHVFALTFVDDLLHESLDLAIDGATGVWHVANAAACSWTAAGRTIADRLGCDPRLVIASDARRVGWRAPRPASSVLDTVRGAPLPRLEDAIDRWLSRLELAEEELAA